jgi:hypothetical protein
MAATGRNPGLKQREIRPSGGWEFGFGAQVFVEQGPNSLHGPAVVRSATSA